jgi:hypothetical protein
MQQFEHPDTHTDYRALKQIRRGSLQSADTAAMNAMFDAIEAGKSRVEAERIFFNTYKQFLSHGNQKPGIDRKRLSNAR